MMSDICLITDENQVLCTVWSDQAKRLLILLSPYFDEIAGPDRDNADEDRAYLESRTGLPYDWNLADDEDRLPIH
jgi:hypothetical protein